MILKQSRLVMLCCHRGNLAEVRGCWLDKSCTQKVRKDCFVVSCRHLPVRCRDILFSLVAMNWVVCYSLRQERPKMRLVSAQELTNLKNSNFTQYVICNGSWNCTMNSDGFAANDICCWICFSCSVATFLFLYTLLFVVLYFYFHFYLWLYWAT